MDAALPVQKSLTVFYRENAFMPDAGMNIETSAAVTPERNNLFWLEVVAGHAVDVDAEVGEVGQRGIDDAGVVEPAQRLVRADTARREGDQQDGGWEGTRDEGLR